MSKKKRRKKRSTSKKRKSRKRKKKTGLGWRIVRTGLLICLGVGLLGGAAVAGLFWHYSQDLPEIFSADDYNPKQVTRIYDRDGNVLLELYDERRTVVPLEEIPQVMRYAIIAAEDADFYEHKGLDYFGVLRAAYTNIQRGGFSQGASTLTQQVVKNLLLTPEREIKRKIQEVLLARRLEEVLTKDEILWIYLNHVYFGHRNYGIEEASRFYFDKHASALNLNEAATLAGLVQSPERLSPAKHPEKSRDRRDYVLRQMRAKGFITESVYQETIAQDIEVRRHNPPTLGMASHFSEMIRRELVEKYGRDYLYTAGIDIYTTVDLSVQVEADHALKEGLREYDERHGYYRPIQRKGAKPSTLNSFASLSTDEVYVATVERVADGELVVRVGDWSAPVDLEPRSRILHGEDSLADVFAQGDLVKVQLAEKESGQVVRWKLKPGPEGGLVCIDPITREVVAMAGGYDYTMSSFNRAIQARRQVGSSFKPIVYAAALDERVITPATVIDDAPKVFHIPGKDEPWSPRNFDDKFKGPMTARLALAKSRNTIAVDVLERVGIPKTVEFAAKIGLESDLVENYTMALGSTELTALESANAFATFASGGYKGQPTFISRIERRGKGTVYVAEREPQRVISEEVAFLITSMMRSVATEGTGRRHLAEWEHYSVGKTGTTNGPRDAWFIGYTHYYVTAVYVGFDLPAKLGRKEGGSKTALPIWASFNKAIHRDLERRPFEAPGGVIQANIDPETGLLAGPHTKRPRKEYFLPGTVPTKVSPVQDEMSEDDWTMRQIGRRPRAPEPEQGESTGDDGPVAPASGQPSAGSAAGDGF